MYMGFDILNVEFFLQVVEILLNCVQFFFNFDYIDFGSGFKVFYKLGGIVMDIEDFGEWFSECFNEFCVEYGKDFMLMFEFGKFLVSEVGYFLVCCNVVKIIFVIVFVGVDFGLNYLIWLMMYDVYYYIMNIFNFEGKMCIYIVVGYICEIDIFGVNCQLSEVREGDIICL